MKLSKAAIKKFGISKRAWQWQRGNKSSSSKRRNTTMAKKKHYSKGKSDIIGKVTKYAVGAGLAVAFEMFISPMIPLAGMMKNLAELVIGIVLMTFKGAPDMVKSAGVALVIVNAYQIISEFISGSGTATNF